MGFELSTFLFEVLNFLVLLWILQRLLYRPLQRAIREREAALSARFEEAERKLREGEEQRASAEAQARELREQAEQERQANTQQALAIKKQLITQAKEEARQERERILATTEREVQRIEERLVEHAFSIAVDLSSSVLAELGSPSLHAQCWQRLLAQVRDHEAHFDDHGALFSARDLSATEQARLQSELEATIGSKLDLGFTTDHTLGAGYRLELGMKSVDASLRTHLSQITESAKVRLAEEPFRVT